MTIEILKKIIQPMFDAFLHLKKVTFMTKSMKSRFVLASFKPGSFHLSQQKTMLRETVELTMPLGRNSSFSLTMMKKMDKITSPDITNTPTFVLQLKKN